MKRFLQCALIALLLSSLALQPAAREAEGSGLELKERTPMTGLPGLLLTSSTGLKFTLMPSDANSFPMIFPDLKAFLLLRDAPTAIFPGRFVPDSSRLESGTNLPGNMAVGASRSSKNAFKSGKIIGKELASLGINVNFSPVLDVNNNPGNPVIGVRSFSSKPEPSASRAAGCKARDDNSNAINAH